MSSGAAEVPADDTSGGDHGRKRACGTGKINRTKASRSQEEAVQDPCTVTLDSHDLTRSTDPKSSCELSIWVINGGEFSSTQQQPMLLAIATDIVSDDLTARIDPGYVS